MRWWIFVFWCFLPFFILFCSARNAKKKALIIRKHLKNKKNSEKGDYSEMLKLIEPFIGKKCNVNTIEQDYTGVIESVEENWIVLSETYYETKTIINLEYVTGIRLCKEKAKKAQKVKQEA